jgi:hypothetical protein
MTTFHFSTIPQGFWGWNLEHRGGNVKGTGRLHCFWDLQGKLQIGIGHWTIGGLNSCFVCCSC